MVEVNNLGLIHLRMIKVNGVGMREGWLMCVRLNTMLMLLTAVIVLCIQMSMRRRPLEHHKGDKQKENKNRVGTSFDHDGIEFKVVSGFATLTVQVF